MHAAANQSDSEYYNASQTISTGKWLIILSHTNSDGMVYDYKHILASTAEIILVTMLYSET